MVQDQISAAPSHPGKNAGHPVTADPPTIREEKIEALREFSEDLDAICRRCDSADGKTARALGASISAECTKCGIRVSGEELLAITAVADDATLHPKIKRMRLGYCARDTCEGLTYRIYFADLPGFAWQTVYGLAQTADTSRRALAAAELAAKKSIKNKARGRMLLRLGMAVGVILLLLLARQWYFGGRIPFIREPEKFRVTPLPPNMTEEDVE